MRRPDDSDPTEWDAGERRHEQCRFGVFSEQAWRVDMNGTETPMALPLCAWQHGEIVPPAVARAWGGAIEYDRDCARCAAFSTLSARGED